MTTCYWHPRGWHLQHRVYDLHTLQLVLTIIGPFRWLRHREKR